MRQTVKGNFGRGNKLGRAVGVSLMVLVFTGVGYIGYKLYANPLTDSDGVGRGQAGLLNLESPAEAGAADAAATPAIHSADDLDKAVNALDQLDISAEGASELTELDSQLSSFR